MHLDLVRDSFRADKRRLGLCDRLYRAALHSIRYSSFGHSLIAYKTLSWSVIRYFLICIIIQYMSSEPTHDTRTTNTPSRRFVLSVLTILLAITVALLWGDTANLFLRRFFSRPTSLRSSSSITTTAINQANAVGSSAPSKMKTPIYFLSHGGVSITPERVKASLTRPAKRHVRSGAPGLPQTRADRSRDYDQGQATSGGRFLCPLAGRP